MTRIVSAVVLAAILAVLPLVAPTPATGCASAPPPHERVEITDEVALILWDKATKTEHFIRRANFRSTATDFGFLVPTPSQPDLGEADDSLFNYLATITAPKVEQRTVKRPRPRPRSGHGAAMGDRPPQSGVEVLEQKQVGGLDAIVLRFHRDTKDNDAAAGAKELVDWLKKHGYVFGPSLVAWLKPYIANDWVMTAFRVATTKGGPAGTGFKGVRGAPVRMSFKTDRPFYPYREPIEEKQQAPTHEQRFLRVYFIGDARFEGNLGTESTGWPARTAWADKLSTVQARTVAGAIKLPAPMPTSADWLTEFEDDSSPRQGTDEVYFKPEASQVPVARPPIIHEIVEWYDEPEPEREVISESTRQIMVWVVIGAGLVALILRLLYGMTRKK